MNSWDAQSQKYTLVVTAKVVAAEGGIRWDVSREGEAIQYDYALEADVNGQASAGVGLLNADYMNGSQDVLAAGFVDFSAEATYAIYRGSPGELGLSNESGLGAFQSYDDTKNNPQERPADFHPGRGVADYGMLYYGASPNHAEDISNSEGVLTSESRDVLSRRRPVAAQSYSLNFSFHGDSGYYNINPPMAPGPQRKDLGANRGRYMKFSKNPNSHPN